MKWIFRAIFAVIGLFILAMIAGAFMTRTMIVERTIEIAAEPYDVFPYINDMRAHPKWSPWLDLDPNAQVVFGGPESGEGQTMVWKSTHKDIGTGSQTITESLDGSFVRTELNFAGNTAQGTYAVNPLDNGNVEALMGIENDLGGFPYIQRLFISSFRKKTEASFDAALENLKTVVETQVANEEAEF